MGETYTYSILIADDEPISRTFLQSTLLPHANKLDMAEDGEEVISHILATQYDFLFMDIRMPKMNGIRTMKLIVSAIPPEKQPVVIAMSAGFDRETYEECQDTGFSDFLPKPVNEGMLSLLLRKWGPHTPGWSAYSSTDLPDHELLNLARIKELKELDDSEATHEVVQKLLGLFREECPQQIESIKAAVETGDKTSFVNISHRLRGSLLSMGLDKAAEICKRLESVPFDTDALSALEKLEELRSVYKQSVAEFFTYMRA